jgi:hypothetical protein
MNIPKAFVGVLGMDNHNFQYYWYPSSSSFAHEEVPPVQATPEFIVPGLQPPKVQRASRSNVLLLSLSLLQMGNRLFGP